MPKRVATCRFRDSRAYNRSLDHSLDHRFVHVMAPRCSSSGFCESTGSGENVLLARLAFGVGIFAGDGMRKLNPAGSVLKIPKVDVANPLDAFLEGQCGRFSST